MLTLFQALILQSAFQAVVPSKPPELLITLQPVGYSGTVGASFQLKVTSNGNKYSFYKGNSLLTENTTGTLTFSNAAVVDSGQYYCIVSDAYEQTLKSNTVTVSITESGVDPEPDPDPSSDSIINITSLTGNQQYTNTSLSGKTYALYRFGLNRFLQPFEYAVMNTGGFTLKQQLPKGDSLVLLVTGADFVSTTALDNHKTYTDTSLSAVIYAVYRTGLQRLLAEHEYTSSQLGGFTLKQPLVADKDAIVVIKNPIFAKSLIGNKTYENSALASVGYLIYCEGKQRFLAGYEYVNNSDGGFTLKQSINSNERLLIFKL